MDENVTARFAPAPVMGAGVEVPLRPGTIVVVTASWSPSTIRADDGSGTRDVQDVSIVQGVFGMRHQFGRTLEIGAGAGAVFFHGDDRAMLAGGANPAPVIEASGGGGVNIGMHRLHIRGVGQLHRFSTEALTSAGASSGNVLRYGIESAFTWKGAVSR